MRKSLIAIFVLMLLFGASRFAVTDGQASTTSIEDQLRNDYHVTRVGANGIVIQAGSIAVVEQDNIKANPAANQLYWSNLYKKDGHVKQPAIMIKSGSSAVEKSSIRFFQVGEKVYITNIEFKPAAIVFSLQSCGACDPSATDSSDVPYRAELSFQFQKGFLDSTNYEDIRATIGQVLDIASLVEKSTIGASSTSATKESTDAKFQPIQPPPPPVDAPPPAPKTISKGDTRDQVIAAFGQPERVANLGAKEIYYYKDLEVTLVNGKVMDVQ